MDSRRFVLPVLALLWLANPAPGQEAPVSGPLRDLARLRQETNEGRLKALREILEERGIPFEAQPFTASLKEGAPLQEGTNLAVTFGAGSREIVVCAHYDAVRLKDGRLSGGMVDNGAGAISLAGLAQALRGRPLRHRVRLLFSDREESGLLGSKSYIAARKPGEIAAAVNLDILGYGDSLLFGGGKAPGNDVVLRALHQVCADRPLACLEFASFPPGDDRSFEAAGIPNVSVAFLPAVEAHQLWLLLNGGKESGLREGFLPGILKIIHTPEDTLDKVDPATLERAPGVLLDLVLKLDAVLD